MILRAISISIFLLLAGCATSETATPAPKSKFTPPSGMSAVRMETGRDRVPLLGDVLGSGSYWIDTIDGKDRRKFDKGDDGFFIIPAGTHEVGLGWAASYLSSFSFITFEMKPGRAYLAYVKHIPHAVEFWIVDAETGELVDEKHTAGIANRPPVIR